MEDAYYNVFTFLNVRDIISFSSVNKTFNEICKKSIIWKPLIATFNTKLYKNNYYYTYKLCCALEKIISMMYYFCGVDVVYNMKELAISYAYVRKNIVPKEIWMLDNLKKLQINLKILVLPTEIGILNKLTTLHFDDVSMFPSEIGELCNLKELVIFRYSALTMPTEIGQLTKLEIFTLFHGDIEELPTEIGMLCNLKEMILFNNNIKKLPTEIGNLYNLEELHIWRTKISNIPTEIGKLDNLKLKFEL
jgi:Leucine-rich repeat (LRR) protein